MLSREGTQSEPNSRLKVFVVVLDCVVFQDSDSEPAFII